MSFKFKKSWFKWLLKLSLSGIILFLLFWCSVYFGFWGKLPSKDDISNIKQAEASVLLDANQELLGKYFIFDRQSVQFNDLPKHLVNALLATEDVRFYEHNGIDYTSLLRVFFKTILLQDNSSGGGSTISQQLAKNIYGRENHGWFTMPVIKTKEMILAIRFEDLYSKEDIIAMYLNTVPFSENVFGIESASQRFFSTSTKDLNLSQCATLIGTLKAPHSYNPRLFPERSQLRRDVVLQQMEKYGYLVNDVRKETSEASLVVVYRKFNHSEGAAAYFREKVRVDVKMILDSLSQQNSETYNLYKDGLKIHTTLDLDMQRYAESAMQQHMASLQSQLETSYGKKAPWISNTALIEKRIRSLPLYKRLKKQKWSDKGIIDSLSTKTKMNLFSWEGEILKDASVIDSLQHMMKFLNTGFVAVNPNNGAVKAYVGGIDFEWFKFDHVSASKRQIGSTFKPIVYTAAIEKGMDACTYYPIKEITYTNQKDWTPTNGGKEEADRYLNYSFEKALSESVNTIAVKVLEDVGIEAVLEQAKRMGIQSDLPKVPSVALGTGQLSMLELVSAYTSFANEGHVSKPFYITKIEDKSGNIIYEQSNRYIGTEAFSEDTRQIMIEMMKSTINTGSAKRIRSTYGLNNDLAGKTGTTQNNKDGWFVGLSPNLVMASWVGNDDHRIGFSNTSIGQGANSALPIVALFLKQMNADSKFNAITKAKFEIPSEDVAAALDCDPEKRDGFLKRLFTKDKKEREFDSEAKDKKKQRKGIFSFLKKKKKDN
ncbi:transglycosylase domain-containing protein [Psychroserpens ponticola]|uniref:Transglycosylase domain-containing protein n=1 Tax=Psychroserpens ponticola TaxID=2932268 RepID=A0ABY7RV96_9FLAO|nr:transglycosylase domain-containing protein [Psychroserpens ponticola]WCO00903.1 transglycosylase domain-containing protein [Psychroserpens ponticola]